MIRIIDDEAVQQLLSPNLAIQSLEETFRAEGDGKAVHAAIVNALLSQQKQDSADDIHYALRSMPGVDGDAGVATLRVNSDILAWPKSDGVGRRVSIPSATNHRYVGFVLLFEIHTCEPLAFIADGFLQIMRVGGSAGVGAKHLAREDAQTLGLIGSSWQAQAQLMSLTAVRPIERVRIYSPTETHREQFAGRMSKRLDLDVQAVASPEAAVRGADIVATATSAHEPVYQTEWLEPGAHITTVRDRELEADVHRKADVVITSRRGPLWQNYRTSLGAHDAIPQGESEDPAGDFIDWDQLPTLSELLVGHAQGRQSEMDITCFYNRGTGIQFPRLAKQIHELALEHEIGQAVPSEWLTQSTPG